MPEYVSPTELKKAEDENFCMELQMMIEIGSKRYGKKSSRSGE